METMLNVTVNGTIHQYPYGTTYRAIAAEFQENYPHQILLVNRDGMPSVLRPVPQFR